MLGDEVMTIYQRIKALREQRGMSQQELAEKVGYKTASAVNKIELGLRDINQTKIVMFAEALTTTPAYLMGWTEEKNSPGVEEKTPRERKYEEIISLLEALPEEKVTEAVRYLRYLAEN